MSLDLRPFTNAGLKTTGAVTKTVNKATGKPAAKAAPKYAQNDAFGAFPSSLLVPTQSDQQMQSQAHAAAGADVASSLAGLPTDASIQGQYGTLGTNIAGINQALVDALGGTQHYQIGTANGVAQGYTNAASGDQQAAQQAALALGGTAAPLPGSSGAAAALSAPGVSAANATGGLIDAAKLRGANLQVTNQQDLATALAGLAAQRTAAQGKEGSYYNQYLSEAQKANQAALTANQGAAFKYAGLGIAQQNANSRAAYDSALAALSGNRNDLTAQGLANTANYQSGELGNAATRNQIAQQNATTAQYRATHPAAGTQKDPTTGLTPAQRTTHMGSSVQHARQIAQGGYTKGTGTKDSPTSKVTFSFTPPPTLLGSTGQPDQLAPKPHPIQKQVSQAAWQQYQQTGDVRALGGIVQQGSKIDPHQQVYTQTTHHTAPTHSYYDTLNAVMSALRADNEAYGYGWTPAEITRRAQQIENPIFHGQYGAPIGRPAPARRTSSAPGRG